VTRFGTIRLRIARTRGKSFLPRAMKEVSAPGEDVAMLIREAFLRGISTRQVGRVVATLTGETVSPQTVSKLTRDLDEAVRQFHQARLSDDYAYLFLDGVSLRVRRPAGRKRVHMLVAYGVRRMARAICWRFCAARARARRTGKACSPISIGAGWKGKQLLLIVTDGCPGLAAAIQTVYPRVRHQRCWVHKMRNILEKVRKRDYDAVKADAQAIYLAESRAHAEPRFAASAHAGARLWSHGRRWSAICPNCCRSSLFPGTCGRNCAPPMSSSAASSKCAEEPGPWSALSM
jgi:putative transposase